MSDDSSSEFSAEATDDIIAIYDNHSRWRERRVAEWMRVSEAGRALYSDNEGQPILRESFAILADELGTSERLSKYGNDDLFDDLGRYENARLLLESPDNRSSDYVRALYFTDNIAVAIPVWSDEEGLGIGFALGIAADYQAELAVGGRFLRGGIAHGMLYADHSFATGRALADAHKLDRKGGPPRILLDSRCLELALATVEGLGIDGRDLLDVERYILRDGDRAFVNYLAAFAMSNRWYLDEALAAHARAVRENLDNPRHGHTVRRKYEWIADYHDYFVTQVAWLPEYVIGSPQSQCFAPLKNHQVGHGTMIDDPLATTFHQASAREEVEAIVAAGCPTAAELHETDCSLLSSLVDASWGAGMAIHGVHALRERLDSNRIPGEHVTHVSGLANLSEQLINEAAAEYFHLPGTRRAEVEHRLTALANTLRVVRQSPRQASTLRGRVRGPGQGA